MSAGEAERLARVALNHLGEPGDVRLGRLAAEIGAVALYDELRDHRGADGLADDVAQRLQSLDPAVELERAERRGLRFVVPGDHEWPTALDDLATAGVLHDRGGPPLGLWVKGPVRLDTVAEGLAVVGSRNSTSYGNEVASAIARTASLAGVPVVSGAAFGIDVAAHRGALDGEAPTVAVLACGADRIYPDAHRDLLRHLGEHEAVVSEAPPGAAPLRIRFLSRNRLIAALTRGTVVVEAAARSGALNTAHWAHRLNRVLMGVPGPVGSATSTGVHQQIRSGAMTLVTDGDEVLELIGRAGEHVVEQQRAPDTERDRLSVRQRQVLDAVPVATPADAGSIAAVAGVGVVETHAALRLLAQTGLVEPTGQGWLLGPLGRA